MSHHIHIEALMVLPTLNTELLKINEFRLTLESSITQERTGNTTRRVSQCSLYNQCFSFSVLYRVQSFIFKGYLLNFDSAHEEANIVPDF